VLRGWRGEHGNWCPGYQRDAHPAADLTVDHVVPLAAGGAPFDIGNCAVLCRSCNSTKGAGDGDRGSPHEGSALAENRESATRRKGWPGNATSLSRELARIAPNLRSVGIDVEKRRESHGRRLISIRTAPEAPSPASPPSPASGAGDATSPEGDGTGLWGEASVTEDRARGDDGDAGDAPAPTSTAADLDVAREALRIFADDLTDESAARLRAAVDGPDGLEWGGLA
jgi:HNH endonuclease